MNNRGGGKFDELVDEIERAGSEKGLSVEDVLRQMGERSFALLLLVPTLVVLSPVAVVPGVPSLLALLIGLIVLQILLGRDHLWLPAVLRRQTLPPHRQKQVVAFLRWPAAWIDPWLKVRLTWLTDPPGNIPPLLICLVISFLMPLIELVPFLTMTLATAMALFAGGLYLRDGVLVVLGYCAVGAGLVLIATLAGAAAGLLALF